MNPQQEAVALWKYLESRGLKPTAKSIGRMLRSHRYHFTDTELFRWLAPFRAAAANRSEPQNEHERTESNRSRRGFTPAAKVSLVSNSSSDKSSEPPTLFGDEATKVTPIRGKRGAAEIDTSWRTPVLEAAQALLDRPINTWSPDERFSWARWHCLMFGNCTRKEGTNKTRASNVVAGLASMALSPQYGVMTGKQYFGLAKKVHALRNGTPWFDPWLVKGAINAVAAQQA